MLKAFAEDSGTIRVIFFSPYKTPLTLQETHKNWCLSLGTSFSRVSSHTLNMETDEIDRIISLALQRDVFLGVFTSANLPPVPDDHRFPFCLISNFHCQCRGGSHWIVIYFDGEGMARCFDFLRETTLLPGLDSWKIHGYDWLFR